MDRQAPPERQAPLAEDLLARAGGLPDGALLAGVRTLLGRERRITAALIAHLAEIDRRRLYKQEGYSSLFVYCRDALGLSEHEAYGRIEAARAARKFPLVLELLLEGSITLTAVCLLARHLSLENHRATLESACGRKKAEVEEIVAALRPVADVRATLRRLPGPSPVTAPAAALRQSAASPAAVRVADAASPSPGSGGEAPSSLSDASIRDAAPTSPPATRLPGTAKPSVLAPLSSGRYRYQLTIDTDTRELLALAKDLLRHVDPCGDDEVVLKRALELLVSDLVRRKVGTAEGRDAARPTASTSRHVPAHVKRAAFLRDRGRCAFVGRQGHRCNERGFLEFHHVKPYAVGGEATVDNIELRCRSHNEYEARLYFEGQQREWQQQSAAPMVSGSMVSGP